jgi:acetyl esterase/lipase
MEKTPKEAIAMMNARFAKRPRFNGLRRWCFLIVWMLWLPVASAQSLSPACGCYRNLVYGPATWLERSTGKQLRQVVNIYPAQWPGLRPLVIYAHANLGTNDLMITDTMYAKVIAPALAEGYSVASVEFRHPVANDDIEGAVPHKDLIAATRWLVVKAPVYRIDTNNLFYLGQSRGSLLIWTAMQLRKPADATPAIDIDAIYTYQAQATYRGQEIADRFVIPSERAGFVAQWRAEHPKDDQFGSALADIGPQSPPLMLKYDETFYRALVPAAWVGVHHPDYGLALCDAYTAAGIGERCQAYDQLSDDTAWIGYTDFFRQYRDRPLDYRYRTSGPLPASAAAAHKHAAKPAIRLPDGLNGAVLAGSSGRASPPDLLR